MKMETRARKRPGDGDEGKRRTRARAAAEERDRSVTDEEVEEFFAILRRLREAPRCFPIRDGSGGSGGVRRRVAAEGWWPRFEREDFEEERSSRDDGWGSRSEEAGSGGEVAAEERVAENAILRRLDLNAEPAPEGPGLGRPGVGSTTPVVAP